MCGIFASNDPQVGLADLDTINSRLQFRGPDGHSGIVICGEWKLYHSRLSIIAPSDRYAQPYMTASGDTIVFNGEILNFRELLDLHDLPQVESDTAALMALLDLDDFDLSKIEGFFAFVRINRHGKLTHCARDRFGVKPLFIHKNGPYISVSSEASVLSDIFDLPYSENALEEYHAFRAPVFSGSYFEGVETVTPGTCLVSGKFFEPLEFFDSSYQDPQGLTAELEVAIRDAVQSRMVADVPVGLLFSGGIDSNLLSHLSATSLHRFCGGMAGDYDMEFARLDAQKQGAHVTTLVEVGDSEFRQRFHEMIRLRKEPLSVPNEVILSFLAEEWANQGGKVLISGEAADEFFAGYDRVYRWAFCADHFEIDEFINLYCYLPRSQISERIVNSMNEFFSALQGMSPFEMVRYFFVKMHLPVLFRRLDFALMFSGIEGREPFASRDIFKLAMKFSPGDLLFGDLGKLPLRILAEKALGRDFAFAPKIGFPVDLGRIFHGTESVDRLDNYEIWFEENLKALK